MIERTSLIHMMAMSDADVLGGAGQLDTARTNSPIQLIIDNEIFGIAQRLRKGMNVDDELFDWEELTGDPEEIEDGFIITDHTLRHYTDATRSELFNHAEGLTLTGENDPAQKRLAEILKNPPIVERSAENRQTIQDAAAQAVCKLMHTAD